MTIKEVSKMALVLPRRSRTRLAQTLLKSLEPPAPNRTKEEWQREIQRRVIALEMGIDPGVSWGKIRARVEKKMQAGQTRKRRRAKVPAGR